MIVLSTTTLEHLIRLIEHDNALNHYITDDKQCVYLQPSMSDYDNGIKYLHRIYEWIQHDEFPGLEVVNVDSSFDMNTLKICIKLDDKRFYRIMCECIDSHHFDHCKAYED